MLLLKVRQNGLGLTDSLNKEALNCTNSAASSHSSPNVPSGSNFEEIEVDIQEEDVRTEIDVPIRVFISEDKRFTVTLKRPSNDKVKLLAEDLGELLGLSKYALTFFFRGDKVGLNERLGDRDIG